MKREEFEAILKRSLELQSLQTSVSENDFSEEDLHAAGERLGIKPGILQKAALLAGVPMLGIGLIPFLFIFVKTGAILGLLPMIVGLLFAAVVIFYSLKTRARGMEKTLTTYFENVQMLGDIEEQKTTRAELETLRKKNAEREPRSSSEPEQQPSGTIVQRGVATGLFTPDSNSVENSDAPPPRPRMHE